VGLIRRRFKSRTAVLIGCVSVAGVLIVGVGVAELFPIPVGFWVAILFLVGTALLWALSGPLQQAYLNEVIPSQQRATVLSFVSLTGSAGGVVTQPLLGRVADVWSLGIGYIVAGVIYVLQLPFILKVRAMHLPADRIAHSMPDEVDDLSPGDVAP